MATLDAILVQWRGGRTVPYAEHLALTLAFHAGIHPRYVWSEALPLHELATAVGWVGMVARGRHALLPRDIAATLADTIVTGADRTGHLQDPRWSLCGLTPRQWGVIGRAARRCLEGRQELIWLDPARRPVRLRVDGRHGAAPTSSVLDPVHS